MQRALSPLLRLTAEVRQALAAGLPIVALESTIISHGMPYPQNVETALALEGAIRARGAVPAHIALAAGRVCIGLEQGTLEALGRAGAGGARKASRRDLASVLAGGGLGATTVAGTMVCAAAAGIDVFATGGIGGVHRGGELSLDVSADLTELGRTPVAVVCAGVKSLLDVQRTLEYLETQGVPVVTLGRRGAPFPTFYSPGTAALASPECADSPAALARAWAASRALGLRNGMVVAVPPPATVPGAEEAIARALAEAAQRGVAGRDCTPFLLARVAELTGGESLAANIALVKNNAAVAADFAVELAALERLGGDGGGGGGGGGGSSSGGSGSSDGSGGSSEGSGRGRRAFSTAAWAAPPLPPPPPPPPLPPLVTVIGGAVLDVLSRPLPGQSLRSGTSNPGVNTQSAGGVGRNIAEVLARLHGSSSGSGAPASGAPTHAGPLLVTAVGSDPAGAALAASCAAAGIALVNAAEGAGGSGAAAPARTATYLALLDGQGELVAAVSDTSILEAALTPGAVLAQLQRCGASGSRAVICDANLLGDTLRAVGAALARAPAPPLLVLEPVSVAKCTRCLPALPLCALVKPNALEVVAMAEAWRAGAGLPPLPPATPRALKGEGGGGGEGEGAGEGGEGAQEGPAEDGPDTRVLVAAQSVLAAMLGSADSSGSGGGSGGGSDAPAPAPALLEGRKHVLVSLGATGVLWLSCAPLAPEGARLCGALPFFAAAAHPQVGFDFQLLPAPRTAVRKVTGAGDTLLGSLVWALVGEGAGMAQALRYGLAGARLALECDPSAAAGGAVPAGLSAGALRRALGDVAQPEEGYS